MLYRLLGKFFFLFYICPALTRITRFVVKNAAQVITKKLADTIVEETKPTRPAPRPKPGYVPQP